ncbi:MAG: Hsp70 family protein, partial [Chloroflexota bacterium]
QIDDLLTEVLARAGVEASSMDEVVLTGGSSAMPAARALLGRRFPEALMRDAAAFSSVAAGLALRAA